jgi:hypothetical protein
MIFEIAKPTVNNNLALRQNHCMQIETAFKTTMQLKHPALRAFTVLLAMSRAVGQRSDDPPSAPALEWLLTYSVDFNLPVTTGDGPTGHRVIWPVRSGKFTGPRMNGEGLRVVTSKDHTNRKMKKGNLHSLGGDWALVRTYFLLLVIRESSFKA